MSEIKEVPTELNEEEEITIPEPIPPENPPPPAPPLKRAKTQQEEEPEEQIPEPEEEIPEPKKKAKAKAAKAKPKGRPKGALGKKTVKQVSVVDTPEIRNIPAATPPHEEEDLSVMLFKMIRQQDEFTRERKRRLYASWFE